MTIIHEKCCKRCGVVRPICEFSPNPVSRDGYWHRCKMCVRYRQVPDSEYIAYMDSGLSRCPKCSQWKDLAEFPKSAQRLNGTASHCLECHRVVANDYASRNRKAIMKRGFAWRKANRERHLQTRRQWRAKNAEQERKRYSEWAKSNADKVRANNARRRARLLGNGGSYTAEEWATLCEKYDNRCLCCGQKSRLVVDHIVPISKGGTSYIDNLQPLCRHCNAVKHDKVIDYRPDSEVE